MNGAASSFYSPLFAFPCAPNTETLTFWISADLMRTMCTQCCEQCTPRMNRSTWPPHPGGGPQECAMRSIFRPVLMYKCRPPNVPKQVRRLTPERGFWLETIWAQLEDSLR